MKAPILVLCSLLPFAAAAAGQTPATGLGCPGAEVASVGPRTLFGKRTLMTRRAAQHSDAWNLGRQFDHVLIIVLENQDFQTVDARPYFHNLSEHGTVFTHFLGNFHPSYPNYLAMVGGKYFDTKRDTEKDLPKTIPTVAHLLDAKGLTWAQYAENYEPSSDGGCNTTRGVRLQDDHYVRRHVPFLSFTSVTSDPAVCARSIVPVTESTHFPPRQLPAYAFYSPNLCHDGHGDFKHPCPVGGLKPSLEMAESWLKDFLNPILDDEAAMHDTLVVLTFDESASDTHNHIYTAFLGDMVKKGRQEGDRCYDHYNVLRTIEDNFGIGTLGEEDSRSDPIVSVFSEKPRG